MLKQCPAFKVQKLEKNLKHYKYIHAFYKDIKRSSWLNSEGNQHPPRLLPTPHTEHESRTATSQQQQWW